MKRIKALDDVKLGYLYKITRDGGDFKLDFEYCFIPRDHNQKPEHDVEHFELDIISITKGEYCDAFRFIDNLDFEYSEITEIGLPKDHPEYLL